MRNLILIVLLSIIPLFALTAEDLLILSDGTMYLGTLLSYDKEQEVRFETIDKEIVAFPSSTVVATRKQVDIASLISPAWNQIAYYPRQKDRAYEISPRYYYRGQWYRMETGYGRDSDILEFFDILKREALDTETLQLIDTLEAGMNKQRKIITAGLLTEVAGTSLMLVPLFLMDDSSTTFSTPTWAAWAGLGGIVVNVTAIGILVSQLFVHYDQYLEQIADSYNSHL